MSKIRDVFCKGKAFIPFITAGDPSLEVTEQLVLAMEKAGADLIELGIPFSDPVAEGTVIQKASERALDSGATTDKIFDMLRHIREKTKVPLALMTYINPIYVYGFERFLKRASECEIDALIVPDLPYEEKEELSPFCKNYGIELISMVAPTSKERITNIVEEAEGFVYCVSSLGVTGVRNEITTNIKELILQVKAIKEIPCAVGFGISTVEQATYMASIADGVIVGSAIVKLVEQYGLECIVPVSNYVEGMKAAIL